MPVPKVEPVFLIHCSSSCIHCALVDDYNVFFRRLPTGDSWNVCDSYLNSALRNLFRTVQVSEGISRATATVETPLF